MHRTYLFSLLFLLFLSPSFSQPTPPEDQPPVEPTDPDIPGKESETIGYIPLKFVLAAPDDLLISPISIGTPGQEMNLVLDIGAIRTWVSSQYFDKSKSTTYSDLKEEESFSQYDFRYSGHASVETFKVQDRTLKEFKFTLVDKIENNNKFQGVLSLGHEYDSKHKSMAYEMSHVSNTFYNMFMFKFTSSNEGELRMGDVNEEIKNKPHLVNKCRYITGGSVDKQIKWRCELTQIFIGTTEDYPTFRDSMMEQTGYYLEKTEFNKLIKVNEPAVFETIFNKIYVPAKLMEYLKENYFKNSNGDSICQMNDKGAEITWTCSKDEMSVLKRLNFVLSEKVALSFPSSTLFNCVDRHCKFLIEFNSKYPGYILGLPVFKLYDIIFDYNSRDLMFYSTDNKYLISVPLNVGASILTIIIWILIIAIILMILGLALIYFMRSKNRKRKEIEEQIYEDF